MKRPDDFLRYADYLRHVYQLLRKRRQTIDYWQKRNEIEDVLNAKVDHVYRRVCERFPADLDLWTRRIAFARKCQRHDLVSRIYGRLLAIHSQHVSVWRDAAVYEYGVRGAFGAARTLLQAALRVHANSIELYGALVECECAYVKKLIERRNQLTTEGEANNDEQKIEAEESSTTDAVLKV